MRITEAQLRTVIRAILNEDLAGFRKRTDHIRYGARGSEWDPDTTFIDEPDNRILARDVKRAWSAEADHDFMSSLTKVHWIVYPEQAEIFMGLSGRNEISAKGYLPRAKLDRPLGGVGFIVQGRVTLAANSQDTIYSGMSGRLPPETHKRFEPSGTPKRARNFSNWISANYMLDRQSFRPEQHNELIVDNWKIIAVVINIPEVFSSFTGGGLYDWTSSMGSILESGIPLYDMDMKPVSPGMILQALKDAEGKPKVYDFDQQMGEGALGHLTKDILNEDLAGFMDKTKDISYRGFVQDPTFDLDWNKKNKAAARSVKQVWAAEADHKFMSSAIKIHWLKRAGLQEKLQNFLSMSGRNEISTMGYLPETETFMANWGPIGVVVQGRTTLAANRMSTLMSGYGGSLPPETVAKYAASGTPKRATFFAGTAARGETSLAGEYILDRASFDPAQQGGNEFIVANWTPVGIALAKPAREIMFNQAMGDMYTGVKETEIGGYIAAAESTGLPWTSEEDQFNVRLWKDRVGSKQQVNESAGGIPWREQVFGDARGTWRVGELHDYAELRCDLQLIPISILEENNLDHDEQDPNHPDYDEFIARAMRSDPSKEIIVVNYPDGLWIADGNHRTWKARELGIPDMSGWILDWEEIEDIPHDPPSAESAASPY